MSYLQRFLILLCLIILLPYSILAQEPTQTIRGVIRDSDSKMPLMGVSIVLKNTDPLKGAVTDMEGDFMITAVPIGIYDIQITYIGYETIEIPNIIVTSGKEVVLPVELRESIEELEGVVVTAAPRNPFAVVSKLSFSMKEAKQYAGSFNDPSRIVTTAAGVFGGGGADDVDNEIIIRGNSPRGLLWRIEGIEVPSPNHFTDQGASSGSISILSSNVLASSDFYTGAFSAEYGNALSGVFDIKLRKGNKGKREYALRAGVLGIDAALEGPFKEGGGASYLVNYRYSTLSLLNDIGIELVENALPVFQDLSFNVNIPTERMGNFSIFGIGGLSEETEFTEGRLSDGSIIKVKEESFGSDLGLIGVKHNYTISDKAFVENILSFSASQITFKRAVPNAEEAITTINNEDFVEKSVRYSTLLNHKFNKRHLLRTGLIYSSLGYDLLSQSFDSDQNELVDIVRESGNTGTIQSYVNWKFRVTKDIVLNTGLHFMHLFLNEENSIEPRFGAKWSIDEKQSLSLGVGLHSKREDLATYLSSVNLSEGVIGNNRQLGFSKSWHYVLGYQKALSETLQLKVETYYQDLFNIPVLDDTFFSILNRRQGFTSFELVNKGTGENYGIELTLSKQLAKGYYWNTNLSLFQSKYIGGDDVERNTLYNGNFILNALGGKEISIGKNKLLNLNVRGVYAGGQRFIPIDLEASQDQGRTIFSRDGIYENRLADYFRTDFQASYTINLPKNTWEFRVDIQNVMNAQNVREIQYNPTTQSIEEVRRGQLIPVISAQVKF